MAAAILFLDKKCQQPIKCFERERVEVELMISKITTTTTATIKRQKEQQEEEADFSI